MCAGVLFPEKVPPISFSKGSVLPTGVVPLLYSRTPIPDCSPSVSWPNAVLGWLFNLSFPICEMGQSQPWSQKVQYSREKVWEPLSGSWQVEAVRGAVPGGGGDVVSAGKS